MANAQNLRLTTNPEILSFNFQNIDIATQLIAIAKNLNWERNVSYTRDITSVKLSPDGDSFLLSMPINSSQTLAGSQIIATLRYQFENLNPVATWAKNFTTPVLSEAQLNDGITTFQVSSDASSFVIRERSDDGRNTVRVFSYDRDKFYFLPIGPTRDDHGGDVSLNYDGSVLFQSLIGLDPAYGIAPKCGSEMTKYRLAITLDEKPELLSWTIDTYQSVGPLVFSDKLIRSCDGCYFDNDRFGKGLVAEDICVSIDNELCGRFRFEARSGFRPGAGLRLSREGSEVFSHIGNSTNEISFFMGNPDDCKIEELKCDDHESHILFILNFDTLPSETYWSMEDELGNLLDSGGNYTIDAFSGRTELYQMCGPKDSDYKLVLEDRSGQFPDGICCDDGNGGYDLYVDFVKIYTREGERAFRFDTVVFNGDGIVKENVPIMFEFQLDGYPDETAWTVRLHDRTVLFSRQFYRPSQKNELVSDIVYLSPGQDYELGIGDGYGDGFCCGSGDGYFRIYDGDFADTTKLLTSGNGEFTGAWMYVNFTVPTRGSNYTYLPLTASPTQAPLLTVSPTQSPSTRDER